MYFGLHAGRGEADTNYTLDLGVVQFTDSFEAKGGLAGAHLGLNVQLGSIVLGGEFSLSGTSIDGSKSNCFAPAPGIGLGITCSKEDDWLLLAMGRLGFAPNNSWMVYGTAGWAVAGATTNLNLGPGINPNLFRASAVHDGFAWGLGLEYQFSIGHWGKCCNSIVLGLEYLHVDLDEQTHQGAFGTVRHVSQDLDIIRARISIKLDPCTGCGHGHRPLK